jgi:peptide/nickel transport system permease protein
MRVSPRHVGRRAVEYGLTFLVAVGINFLLPYLAPGDPLIYVIGPEATELSPAEREAELARYGPMT